MDDFIVSNWAAAPRIDPSIKDAIYGAFGYTPEKDVARAAMKVDTLPYRAKRTHLAVSRRLAGRRRPNRPGLG